MIPTFAPFLLPEVLRLLNMRHLAPRTILREGLRGNLLLRLEEGLLEGLLNFALTALTFDTANCSSRRCSTARCGWSPRPAMRP